MRVFLRSLLLAAVLILGYALLEPWLRHMLYAIRLAGMPAPASLAMPVQGVLPRALRDTWHAARGQGRKHEGIDIFARRGTPVLAATEGIVLRVGSNRLGGLVVWVLGPALERHYYAHLDDWREGLAVGDVVLPGDVLGYVGDTGNARGTPPHLHYGIYADGGALDPLPRLRTAAVDPPGTAPAR